METDGNGGTPSQADQLPQVRAVGLVDGELAEERQCLDTGLMQPQTLGKVHLGVYAKLTRSSRDVTDGSSFIPMARQAMA